MKELLSFIRSTKQVVLGRRKQTQLTFLGIVAFILSSSVSAASYVVTTTSDLANPPGATSLRGVLNAVNQNSSCNGVANISFNIKSGSKTLNGVKYYSIQPGSATSGLPLPVIHCPINIHGPNSDGASIELDGQFVNATPNPPASFPAGLMFVGRNSAGAKLAQNPSGSTIKNLVINRFPNNAIYIYGADNFTIVGNFMGVDVTGELPGYVDGYNAAVGGIAGSGEGDELRLEASSHNFIGTTASDYPLRINSANRNVIGECSASCISLVALNDYTVGFGGSAPVIPNLNSANNVVQDTYMGVNKEGTNIIGGFDTNDNQGTGPNFPISAALGNMIYDTDNYNNVFTTLAGNNVYGGLLPGQGNILASSSWEEVNLSDNNDLFLGNTLYNSNYYVIIVDGSNNTIENNNIGTDVNGSCSNPAIYGSLNDAGIWVDSGNNNIVLNNVIAKTYLAGIRVTSVQYPAPISNALVANNYIGTDRSQTQNCGVTGPAILVAGDVTNSQLIGNVMANNGSGSGENGIVMRDYDPGAGYYAVGANLPTNPVGISVLSNQIAPSSPGLGIAFNTVPFGGFFAPPAIVDVTQSVGNGPVLNTMISPVADQPNGLQNNPVLVGASISNHHLIVTGNLTSEPSTSYLIQVYAGNPAQCIQLSSAGPAGYQPNCPVTSGATAFLASSGNNLLGQTIVQTDSSGNAYFNFRMGTVSSGTPIVATATRIDTSSFIPVPRDTSEFSQAVLAH